MVGLEPTLGFRLLVPQTSGSTNSPTIALSGQRDLNPHDFCTATVSAFHHDLLLQRPVVLLSFRPVTFYFFVVCLNLSSAETCHAIIV